MGVNVFSALSDYSGLSLTPCRCPVSAVACVADDPAMGGRGVGLGNDSDAREIVLGLLKVSLIQRD